MFTGTTNFMVILFFALYLIYTIILKAYEPSIYDVHAEGEGSGSGRRTWTGRGGFQAACGRPHRKLKLESTDVILSSSHAKKLVYFLPEFRLWTE